MVVRFYFYKYLILVKINKCNYLKKVCDLKYRNALMYIHIRYIRIVENLIQKSYSGDN